MGEMMPTRTWTGNTDGDWNTASNWAETAVPGDGDDVYITSGSVSIDGYDASATDLTSLTVGSSYTGTIGSSGTKLKINATTFNFAGASDAYIDGSTFTNLIVQSTSSSSTALNLSNVTITNLRVFGGFGTVTVSSGEITTKIEQIGADGVTLNIADGLTIGGSCTLTVDSGILQLNQAVPTITVFGGLVDIQLDSGTITTLNQYGGRIRWIPTASCTITALNIYSGLFDSKDSTSPTYTITDATVHENGTINEASGISNATWTNPISMEGGKILYDSGRSVTIT